MAYYCQHERGECWQGCNTRGWPQCVLCEQYQLGAQRPRYPVPALRGWNYMPQNGGGVMGDSIQIGGMYLDWSRGRLEVY